MSELRADTITASDGTSPVTLTKQSAAKHFVRYNAINQTTDVSLNQSSLTDTATGDFSSNFTNAYNSASDKAVFVNSFNSVNNTSRSNGYLTGGIGIFEGNLTGTFIAQSASLVNFGSGTLGDAGTHGNTRDYWSTYCMTLGDLA